MMKTFLLFQETQDLIIRKTKLSAIKDIKSQGVKIIIGPINS